MKAMTFKLRAEPAERLDLSGLTPALLAGLTVSQIEKLRIASLSVGDIFEVSGKETNNLVFERGSLRFDRLGAGLTEGGTVRVSGDAGSQAGRKMAGSLIIEGSAADRAGSAMTGGRLEINGNAGDSLGGPAAGEITGMEGGILIVRGKAGAYVGDRLRRGIIAVLKGCGDYAGYRMIAGTIVATGRVGAMPGYLMKRGSLLFDRHPDQLSPSFVASGSPDIAFSGVFDRYLIDAGIMTVPLLGERPGRYGGDNAVSGKGEILYRGRR